MRQNNRNRKPLVPWVVLGSAPNPTLPDVSWDDAKLVCVNASGWTAKNLGLPIPYLTVMTGSSVTKNNEFTNAACKALSGLSTHELVVIEFGAKLPYVRKRLAAIDYHYESVAAMSRDGYADIVLEVIGEDLGRSKQRNPPSSRIRAIWRKLMPLHLRSLVRARLGKEANPENQQEVSSGKVSSGLFAVILALYRNAPLVIMSGFSLSDGGHSYLPSAGPRYHAVVDKYALHLITEFNLPVVTSEPKLAEIAGIKLFSNS